MTLAMLSWWFAFHAMTTIADDGRPWANPIAPNYDETGRKLPAGVPRSVDTNGVVEYVSHHFTTPAYQKEALKMVVQEANQVAKTLKLTELLPITQTNLAEYHVSPFGFAYAFKMIGTATTKNYVYCVSVDNKFSYLEGANQDEACLQYLKTYTWPLTQINTNAALKLAEKWLKALSIDVKGLNRECQISVVPDMTYVHPPAGKFVPVYDVSWNYSNMVGNAASVRLFLPTKKLLQLRIEDPKYNLRSPVVFTNLEVLFPGIAVIRTNYPTVPVTIDASKYWKN